MRLINSATVTAPGGLVVRGRGFRRVRFTVRYGLIDRGGEGLCLVDTGYGPSVTTGDARSRAVKVYNGVLRPTLDAAGQPAALLASLGATAADVRTIVLTHFHADHVANLAAFPRARIIASVAATKLVLGLGPLASLHNGIFKELIPTDLASRLAPLEDAPLVPTWTSLGLAHDIFGNGLYLAVPLPGHALGHFGLVWREGGTPVCYATDASWALESLRLDHTGRLARALVFHDRHAGIATEKRLRAFLAEGGEVRLCHDIEAGPA